MRIEIPEIYWHGNKERIMSIDFFPFSQSLPQFQNKIVFVTGGTDSESQAFIKVKKQFQQWEISPNESSNDFVTTSDNEKQNKFVKFVANITHHKFPVNCVKFSPNGQFLASAADDKETIIWELKSKPVFGTQNERIITWCYFQQLHGHSSDVMDLKWTPDLNLITGSVDNTAIIWAMQVDQKTKKTFWKQTKVLDTHTHYIQGVALDPLMKFAVTQSLDRTSLCRLQTDSPQEDEAKEQRLFLDQQSIQSFFRRPDFAPDGSFFLLPAASYQPPNKGKPLHCVLLYLRNHMSKPSLILPTQSPAILTCINKTLFKSQKQPYLDLLHTIYFAVGTVESVLVYNTEHQSPLYIVGNLHYQIINDMSWLEDKVLGVASSDGYCSFLVFDQDLPGVFPSETANYYRQNGVEDRGQMQGEQKVIHIEKDGQVRKMIVPMMMKN